MTYKSFLVDSIKIFSYKYVMLPNIFNFRANKVVSILLSIVVIGINTYFVINTVNELNLHWFPITIIVIVGIMYLIFCAYLVVHMVISMGNTSLLRYGFVKKYVMGPVDATLDISPISYAT